MRHSHSRRDLLKVLGMAGAGAGLATQAPVQDLVNLMLKDSLKKAHAAGAFVDTKYLLVALHGSPPRWIFDQFLKTRPGENITANPAAHNRYVTGGGQYTQTSYDTIAHPSGVLVPPLWGTTVPAAGGGVRPMASLLNHMLTVRGYGTGIDGHTANGAKQSNPLPAAGSVSGHMADNSSTLFKAAQFFGFGPYSGYSSRKGTSLTSIQYGGNEANHITRLLNPFGARVDSAASTSLREKYKNEIDRAQGALKEISRKDNFDSGVIAVDHTQALQKIKEGVASLDARWPALLAKYVDLIRRSYLGRSSAGFDDLPVVNTTNGGGGIDHPSAVNVDQGAFFAAVNADIRPWFDQADFTPTAAGFALAEFILTEDLVSAYELYYYPPTNLRVATAANGILTSSLIYDQHNTGVQNGVFMNACLFRALSSCLLELTDQLKAKNIFDKTVIHVTQDFGRLPRNTGGGSDHGFDAMISSLITGKRTSGPMVLGNVLASGTNGTFGAPYDMCFGYKAPTNVDGVSTMLTPAHVTSTLAVLLGLPHNPWGNVAAPLVALNGGAIVAKADAVLV